MHDAAKVYLFYRSHKKHNINDLQPKQINAIKSHATIHRGQ